MVYVADDPLEDFRNTKVAANPLVDFERPEDEAEVYWAGRPTTMAAVERVAKANKVSPNAIMELGTLSGRIESRLAQGAVGQTVLRAGEGIKSVGEGLAAGVARAAGRDDIAARVHEHRRQREEFLQFIEQGGDVQSVLGERGSRIFNQTTQSLGGVGTSAVLAGPVGIYAHAIGSSWEQGLDDAQRNGLEGVEAVGHAGRSAVIEGGLTFLMGQAGARLGLASLEESFSPAARSAVRKQLAAPASQSAFKKAAVELGGWTAEGVEEMLIAGGQQANEMAAGLRDGFDWDSILDAGASGVAGRGTVGAVKSLKNQIAKMEAALPELIAGTRAAEIDIERGVNPMEALELVGGKKFDAQTGREGTTKAFRDSYRDALNFYIEEARQKGETGALAKMEQDVAQLREEDRQRSARIKASKEKNKGKTGESTVTTEAAVEPPIATADERATFRLADFEARLAGRKPADSVVDPPTAEVNPYLLAPWETETRPQRRIRKLSLAVAGYKEQIKEMRKSFATSKRLREDQFTTARELVQENIPRVDQWKFLNGIQKAKSPAAVDTLLERVEKHIDERDHRLAIMGLKQAFSKASNLRSEFAAVVKNLRGGIDLSAIKNRDAAEAIQTWAKENPQAILTDKDRDTIARLEAKENISDMDAEDIRALSEYVQRLAYESGIRDRLIGEQQSAAIRDVADSITQEASSALTREMRSSSLKDKLLARGEDVEDTLGTERTLGSMVVNELAERPEATLRKISPTLTTHIYDKLAVEDQNRYDLAAKQVTESLAGVFNVLGLTHDDTIASSIDAVVSSEATPLEAWRNQKRKVSGVELTRGEALMISRWLADPHARRSIMQAGVELDEGKRVVPPMDAKALAELADFVGEQGAAVSQFMFDYDNGPLIDSVNDTNEKLTGRSLTDKRDVVPIVRSEDDFTQFISRGRSTAGYQEALLDSYRSFKHRTGGVSALKIPQGADAIDMFMIHADRMNRFAAFGVNARNAEMLLNDSEIKTAITEKNGRQGYEHIVNAVLSHVVGHKPRTEGEKMLSAVNAGVVASQIAGRVSIMLQQGLDPVTAAPWDEGGIKDLASGYAELNARGLQSVENEMEQVLGSNSGNYWRRYKSEDFVGEHTSGQFRRLSYFRPSRIAQQFMRPTARAEFFAAAMPNYLAAKAAARRQFGLSDNDYSAHPDNPEWIKSVVSGWDKKTYRGSNSSHGLELSGVLRYSKDNPMAATLTNFYNTASKVYSLWAMGTERLRQGRHAEATSYLSAAAVNALTVAALGAAMSHGEKEKETLSLPRRVLNRMITGIVSLNPFGGQLVADQVVGPLLGMPSYGDNPSLVADTALKTAKGGVGLMVQLADLSGRATDPEKFNERLARNTEDFIVGLGSLSGAPLPGAVDIAKRVSKGTATPGLMPAAPKQPRGNLVTY